MALLVVPHQAISGVVTDPNDDPIIDLAVTAKVEYLVTSDKRVLDVGQYQGVKILAARDFCDVPMQQTTS